VNHSGGRCRERVYDPNPAPPFGVGHLKRSKSRFFCIECRALKLPVDVNGTFLKLDCGHVRSLRLVRGHPLV
jgi:hypothetical protein